jgi:tetratricopeptide (TPR) repeat protein
LDFRDVKQNISKLRQALSLTDPSTCKALVIQSQIHVIQRNLHKALELLNQAYDLADNDGERGEVAYFRYARSSVCLQFASVLIDSAFSNWWIDRDTDAINDFNIALSFHYNVKSCYTQLAEIYAHLGKPRVCLID